MWRGRVGREHLEAENARERARQKGVREQRPRIRSEAVSCLTGDEVKLTKEISVQHEQSSGHRQAPKYENRPESYFPFHEQHHQVQQVSGEQCRRQLDVRDEDGDCEQDDRHDIPRPRTGTTVQLRPHQQRKQRGSKAQGPYLGQQLLQQPIRLKW